MTSLTARTHQMLAMSCAIAAHHADTIHAMNVAAAGWPDHVPGAPPSTATAPPAADGDGSFTSNATERAALQHDPARADLTEFLLALDDADAALRRAAAVLIRWCPDTAGVDGRMTIDEGLYCAHEASLGFRTLLGFAPGPNCGWCRKFNRRHKRMPPPEVIRLRHERGDRLSEVDVLRALRAVQQAEKDAARRRQKSKDRAGSRREEAS